MRDRNHGLYLTQRGELMACALLLLSFGMGCPEGFPTLPDPSADAPRRSGRSSKAKPSQAKPKPNGKASLGKGPALPKVVNNQKGSKPGRGEAANRKFPLKGGTPARGLTTYACTSGPLSCDRNDCYEEAVGTNNDRESRATPLGFGQPIKAVACGKDWDWYRLKVPLGCVLDITLEHTEGDLDLYIYAPQVGGGSTDRAHAKSEGRQEQLQYVTRSKADHWLAVVPTNGGGVYTLSGQRCLKQLPWAVNV
ncbi:MAG: PPC domain-containing protein [Myxococcota bacterium]